MKYIPVFKVNLISLTRYMMEGWVLGSDRALNIILFKGKHSVHFDQKIITGLGVVLGIKVKQMNPLDMSALVWGRDKR